MNDRPAPGRSEGSGRVESPNRIETPRLLLIPATIPLLEAEGAATPQRDHSPRGELEALLGAEVATPWPPPLNDEGSRQWMIRQLRAHPEQGWGTWYFVLKRGPGERAIAIGNGGFKGPPSADGTVEIGYSIVEGYQGQGLGAEAIRALVEHALGDSRVQRAIAETFGDNDPSIRVLEKNGFRRVGVAGEPGALRFERRRETPQ